MHIISHGTEGQLDLGSTVLNAHDDASNYAAEFATIKAAPDRGRRHPRSTAAISAKARIGEEAAGMLAEMTGADVAASTDATGDAALGGNWDLELQTGTIESRHRGRPRRARRPSTTCSRCTRSISTPSATWTSGTSKTYTVDGSPITISVQRGQPVPANPSLSQTYTGGVATAAERAAVHSGPTGLEHHHDRFHRPARRQRRQRRLRALRRGQHGIGRVHRQQGGRARSRRRRSRPAPTTQSPRSPGLARTSPATAPIRWRRPPERQHLRLLQHDRHHVGVVHVQRYAQRARWWC